MAYRTADEMAAERVAWMAGVRAEQRVDRKDHFEVVWTVVKLDGLAAETMAGN